MTPDLHYEYPQTPFELRGGGVTGDLFRSIRWAEHPLGDTSRWPASLRTALNILFHSHHSMFMFWGEDLFQFYNDAYLPSLGTTRHPLAMGQRGEDCWEEIWSIIKPQIDLVMGTGGATWNESQRLSLNRHGTTEDTYWTYGYSPIFMLDGKVGGVLVICTETTSTEKNARALRSNKDDMEEILESMSDAFISLDKNWHITRVNCREEQLARIPRSEQIGRHFLELYFANESFKKSAYWQAYHRAMQERVAVTFEDFYEPLNLWTEVRAFPKADGGLTIFFTDVSKHKEIEATLATEKRKLEVMMAKSPAGLALLRGANFIFERVNGQWQELVSKRDYIGKQFSEAYPEVDITRFTHILTQVFVTGTTFHSNEVRVRVERHPGRFEHRYYDISYMRIDDGKGQPYGIFAHSSDVTDRVLARKRLEYSRSLIESEAKRADQERAKFEAAFQAVAEGIFIFSSEGNPMYMNDAAAKIFGSESAADLMKRVEYYFERLELRDLNDRLVPISEWPIARALRGESFRDWQLKAHRQDTDNRWIWSASGELARQKGSNITLGVVVLRDITNQKQIECDLIKAKHQAETANLAKSAFLANMSHEIRTPLGAILGFTELMRDAKTEEERAEFAKIISRNGKSLTRIIDDILDLSKVESGRLEIEMLPFSVRELLSGIKDLFTDIVAKKQLALNFAVDTRLPNFVVSDPTRIRQILINLVGNAIKFTSEGSVTVNANPISMDGQLDQIEFIVKDTGVGLTSEQISKLFEPFSQADNSTTRRFGGSGLGLALSKRLALALGGNVKVSQSGIAQGSTFVVNVKAGDAASLKKSELESISKPLHTHAVPLRVLLVEDSLDNQLLVKRLLTLRGMEVVIAENGLDAISKVNNQEFDIILMDMQMPILDGYAATEHLRQSGYRKPIIALTAHAMAEERKRTARAGCDAHLTKPVDATLLIHTIVHFNDMARHAFHA